ncbi:WhiB family transcriptional regulator [Streptomyces sp. SCL15-4]|uniref:WhiB family transcriptional regulator n=1 Tax=Streptomyces sp. SCL15-4 TaxID=2967221 RepID=UPI00296719F9|nr:WhiB family transcriptional regulator [Streptomyces sp. SCL15-4]
MTIPAAPCRTDPDRWFSTDPTERAYAARQCHPCPLLLSCMRQALAAGETHGVWGGVDFETRPRRARTAAGRTHAPTAASQTTSSPNGAPAATQALPVAS